MNKHSFAQFALLMRLHNPELFAVRSTEQEKYYFSVVEAWRDCELPNELCELTPLDILYYTRIESRMAALRFWCVFFMKQIIYFRLLCGFFDLRQSV